MTLTIDLDLLGRDGRWAALVTSVMPPAGKGRTTTVPPGCTALVFERDQVWRIACAGDSVERARLREAIVVAGEPLVVAFDAGTVVSRDGFDVPAQAQIEVCPVAEKAEMLAMRAAFLSRAGIADEAQVSARFTETVRRTIAAYARGRTAEQLVRLRDDAELGAILRAALGPEFFAVGLSLVRVMKVGFQSPQFERMCREEQSQAERIRRARTDIELQGMLAAARAQRLAGLETLLMRLAEIIQRQPGLTWAELIRTFGPADRGELYRGLLSLESGAVRAETLLVAAGDELLSFPSAASTEPLRRRLSPEVGPARSVRVVDQAGRRVVLVGGRRGVQWIEPDTRGDRVFTFNPAKELRGGVNAATIRGGQLLATHSEVGLVAWDIESGGEPTFPLAQMLRRASAVRDVQADADGGVWLTADEVVLNWRDAGEECAFRRMLSARVETLRVYEDDVYAGLDDGRIVRWPRASGEQEPSETIRGASGEAVGSLAVVEHGGLRWLLVADGRSLAELMVPGDTCRLVFSAAESIRWCRATAAWVAGVSESRDKLYLWSMREPERAARVVSVGRLCGHSIQDVAWLPEPAVAGTATSAAGRDS